ncbi:MAG TPA: hypothetical protein VFE13_19620, partial [Caulobacteraceae bacterium]|nr:hypothetical protein [Caulobacteraceae bacterium]
MHVARKQGPGRAPGVTLQADRTVRPDTVIGDQNATYHLSGASNPFYVDSGTTITTASGDGIDGGGPVAWTLTNAGVISGAAEGVKLNGASTVINSGTIEGAAGLGLALNHGGALSNLASGVISGATGVFLGAAGTVTNAGGVTGVSGAGVALFGGGDLTNAGAGDIIGRIGVHVKGGAGTVVNYGSVTGAIAEGAVLGAGGTFNNEVGGSVNGATNGVNVAGAAGTVINSGAIAGADGAGVVLRAGGSVDNATGGATITGSYTGVYLHGSGSVANSGVIQATAYYYSARTGPLGIGIDALGSGADVATITNTGSVYGPAIGVRLVGGGGGSLTNAAGGKIIAGKYVGGGYTNASEAVYARGSVANAGTIASYGYRGLGVSALGSLDNQAGALISAMQGYSIGVILVGSLHNAGTIQASAYGAVVGPGSTVTNDAGGTITGAYWGLAAVTQRNADVGISNAGTISATGTYGVGVYLQSYSRATAQGFITNSASGVITGSLYGIEEEGSFGRAITNDGLVGGGYVAIAIGTHGQVTNRTGGQIAATGRQGLGIGILDGGRVVNQAGASITGVHGIEIDGRAGTIINAGTIAGQFGSVMFTGTGDNVLALATGSVLAGKAFGSTAVGATNTLRLQGHGAATNRFQDFNALIVRAAGTWRLDAPASFDTASIVSGALQIGDAKHLAATVAIAGALDNAGVLRVVGGELDVGGPVTGAGSVAIAGGA